jgi:hypothetical protein
MRLRTPFLPESRSFLLVRSSRESHINHRSAATKHGEWHHFRQFTQSLASRRSTCCRAGEKKSEKNKKRILCNLLQLLLFAGDEIRAGRG